MGKIVFEKTDKGFEYWATRPYLKLETQERVRAADVLLVPQEQFRGEEVRVFPVNTDLLFAHIREQLGDRYKSDLAIEDEEYKQLSLHSVILDLGTFVVCSVVVPVLVSILSDYVKKTLNRDVDKEKNDVRCVIVSEQRTTTVVHQSVNINQFIIINYNGSQKDFPIEMADAAKRLAECERPDENA